MENLPCQGCRGLCCGPVPVTERELTQIKRKIKSMSRKNREELENQHRFFGTCIFYDLDRDRCGIHSVRPGVCEAFGQYRNLVCFRQPDAASESDWHAKERAVGVLSVDFTWKDF